jgi:hypothetical protein
MAVFQPRPNTFYKVNIIFGIQFSKGLQPDLICINENLLKLLGRGPGWVVTAVDSVVLPRVV